MLPRGNLVSAQGIIHGINDTYVPCTLYVVARLGSTGGLQASLLS